MLVMLGVIAPMFFVIVIGYLAGFTRRFSGHEPSIQGVLNSFLFYFALPSFLYTAVVEAPPTAGFPGVSVLIAGFIPVALAVAVFYACRLLGQKSWAGAGPVSLSATFGNVGYFGIPITISVLGPEAGLAAGILHMVHNLIFMSGYPVVRTAVNSAQADDGAARPGGFAHLWRTRLWPIVRRAILLNPVVLAMTVALVVVFTPLQMPDLVEESLGLLGQIAVPLALFCVGLAMHPAIAGLRSGGVPKRAVGLGTAVKILALPALTYLAVLPLAGQLGPIWGGTLILMAAMPSSTTVFVFTREYDGDARMAASILVATTVASLVTLPLIAEFMLV